MQAIEGDKMNDAIASTKKWLEEVVVKLNFCPFAGREVIRDSIRFVEIEAIKPDPKQIVLDELQHLEENVSTETTLVVFTNALTDFRDYLDWIGDAEQFLEEEGFEGVYQLATFHPKYQFAGAAMEDPSNYTNRSPFPTLHILREESLDKAIDAHGNTDEIPETNIALTEKMGISQMQKLLAQCYVKSKA